MNISEMAKCAEEYGSRFNVPDEYIQLKLVHGLGVNVEGLPYTVEFAPEITTRYQDRLILRFDLLLTGTLPSEL